MAVIYTKEDNTYTIDSDAVVAVQEMNDKTCVYLSNGMSLELDNTADAVVIAEFKTAVTT